MKFIGLDLAWSTRNATGAAALEGDGRGGRLVATELLGSDDEIVAFVATYAPEGPAIVAIDAPLVVPNLTGRRRAEAELGAVFARAHAGAHPSNRTLHARDGTIRGEVLVALLAEHGFAYEPAVVAGAPTRQIVEVYPHPAIVSLFSLDRIVRYKAKRANPVANQLAELARYQRLLRSLADADPALVGADELLAIDASAEPIKAHRKGIEDRLDALLCAYVAQYLWRWGMDRARVFGDRDMGAITTPIMPVVWLSTPPTSVPGIRERTGDRETTKEASVADAGETRIERDTMGEVRLPKDALWAAQTQRAVDNFPVSGRPLPPRFVRALGLVKLAAARVNRDLGLLDPGRAGAIEAAARAVADGNHDDAFPLDVFQTGSGTSSNMNANEVIATLANRATGETIHPNDHVNLGQSSNDVIPTVLHVSAVLAIEEDLIPALRALRETLAAKAEAFDPVVKIGRTHLMDAVPIRLGQEFSGYARQIDLAIGRVEATLPGLRELAIGGTAVGTGLNTHAEFGERVAAELSTLTGTEFREAENHFEAQGARDAYVFAAGALSALAAALMKIANDVRLLASGPQAGLGELILPAVQPGSSIMPGKVNPVISESVIQVGAQVTGNCHAVTIGGQWGQLDLNVMLPMMAANLLDSIRLLANVSRIFVDKSLAGTEANIPRCEGFIEGSISMATALNPLIGYDRAAAIAKASYATGRTVRELAYEQSGLTREQVDQALDPYAQTVPGAGAGGAAGG